MVEPELFEIDGLTVIHCGRDKSGSVSISLRVIGGSMYEKSDQVGVAHFLEHIVLDGTEKYPSKRQLSGLIEDRGGFRNAATNKDTIEYHVRVLNEDVEAAFEYLSQVVICPLISNESIEKQKKIIEQEILRFKSKPEDYADRAIYKVVFPGTRIGGLNTGDIEDIKSINKEAVAAFHKETHVAENMTISVCGDISVDDAKRLVSKYFRALKRGNKLDKQHISSEPILGITKEIKATSRQVVVSVAYPGFSIDDRKTYAADIIMNILSRGSISRLNQEIREKLAMAYSLVGRNISGRNYGIIHIRAGVDKDRLREFIATIVNEMKKIASGDISEDEVVKAFVSIKAATVFNLEDGLKTASHFSNMWCLEGKVESINKELEEYFNVSKDLKFIKIVAKELFDKEPSFLVLS